MKETKESIGEILQLPVYENHLHLQQSVHFLLHEDNLIVRLLRHDVAKDSFGAPGIRPVRFPDDLLESRLVVQRQIPFDILQHCPKGIVSSSI